MIFSLEGKSPDSDEQSFYTGIFVRRRQVPQFTSTCPYCTFVSTREYYVSLTVSSLNQRVRFYKTVFISNLTEGGTKVCQFDKVVWDDAGRPFMEEYAR